MEEKGHPIRNSIVATVASGLLLAGALAIWPNIWVTIKVVFSWLGSLLTTTVPIQVWLLFLLSALALLCVVGIVLLFVATRETTIAATDYTRYTQDCFGGLVWRWRWSAGHILDLLPYCPADDTLLILGDGWAGSYTDLYCETCQKMVSSIPRGDYGYFKSSIMRQIDRKVRNGEWKQIVEKQLPNG